MNAALENTEEVVNGKVTNNYGDAFVRGNNSAFSSFYEPRGHPLIGFLQSFTLHGNNVLSS